MIGNALLEVKDLEIRFGGVVAAAGINIKLYEGRNLAIIGPNGAGKTTFLNLCSGYLKPHAGRIFFAAQGRVRSPFTPLGRIPQRDAMMHLLEMVKCAHLADRSVAVLPEGQRKLVDIAIALALKPRLLFMDEPTSGVASSEKFEVLEIIAKALAEANVTAVFVEHDMGIVDRFADEVAVWNRGEVLFRGAPGDVLNHPDVIRDVIGEEI